MTSTTTPSRSALILAGGDGTRLRGFTQRIAGDDRPKQFCRLLGDQTLFEQTLRRTAWLVSPQRMLSVFTRAHERFYQPLVERISSAPFVAQPANRGTAPAILYGLLRLSTNVATGPVAIVPSDHYVSDDKVFMAQVGAAFRVVEARPDLVVLLGIEPDTDDHEYGWIESGAPILGPWDASLFGVCRFWEKPSAELAVSLRTRGCLWNSFVIVAFPSALIAMMGRARPDLMAAFASLRSHLHTRWEDVTANRVYRHLEPTDFSTHVLATCPASLSVIPVRGVTWTDLGTPLRVLATLSRTRIARTPSGLDGSRVLANGGRASA